MVCDGQRSTLHACESAQIEPGVWHDWFNTAEVDAVVRVEVTQEFSDVIVFRKPSPSVQ